MSDDATVKCPRCERVDVLVTRRGCCGAVWATCTKIGCHHQWQIVAAPAPVYLPVPYVPAPSPSPSWYPGIVCDGGTAGTGITGVIADLGSTGHPVIKTEAR